MVILQSNHNRPTIKFKVFLLSTCLIFSFLAVGIAQVDIANVSLSFDSPTSTATTVGSTIKYNSVFSVGGIDYDAIITIDSISNGATFNELDNTSSTQGNQAAFFSPRFTWGSGGGQAYFTLSFIEDDTEANTQYVTFLNFSINSYDLDGGTSTSGAAGQSSSFNNFDSYTLSNSSFLTVSNENGLYSFSCGTNMSSAATDIENWVKASYSRISTFQFSVGASGSGLAYYFFDFSEGTFSASTGTTTTSNNSTPTIVSFSPQSTCERDTIYLSGSNFSTVDSVFIGGTRTTDLLVLSNDSMWAVTPSLLGSPTSDVAVYNSGVPTSSSGYALGAACSTCNDFSACNYGAAEACTFGNTWYDDSDGDGVGDPNSTIFACTQPLDYVAGPGDQCPNDVNKVLPGDCGCGTAGCGLG